MNQPSTTAIVFYESPGFILEQDDQNGIPQVHLRNRTLSPHGWDKPETVTLTGAAAIALLTQVDEAIVKHYDPADVEASEARGMAHIDGKILGPLDERLRNDLETARLEQVKTDAQVWIEEGVRQNMVAFIDAVDRMHGEAYPVRTFLPAIDEDVVREYMSNALRRVDTRPPLSVLDVRIVPLASLPRMDSDGNGNEPLTWAHLVANREQAAYLACEEPDDTRFELSLSRGARGYNLWSSFDVIARVAGVTVRSGIFDAFDAMGAAGTTVFSVQPASDGVFELLLHQNGQVHVAPIAYGSETYAVKEALDFERKFVTPHARYHAGGFGRLPKDDVLPVSDLVNAWSEKDPATVLTQPGQRPGTTPGLNGTASPRPDSRTSRLIRVPSR